MGRDNARTPMQWDDSPHAGFTTGHAVDRGQPEPRRDQRRGAARRPATRCSTTTARLIALRHDEPVVAHGDFTMLLPDDEHVYAFTRRLDGATLLVLGNFSGDEQDVDLGAGLAGGELVLGNYPDADVRPAARCDRGRRGSTAPDQGVVPRVRRWADGTDRTRLSP